MNVFEHRLRNAVGSGDHVFVGDVVAEVFENVGEKQESSEEIDELKGLIELLLTDTFSEPFDEKGSNVVEDHRYYHGDRADDEGPFVAPDETIETSEKAHEVIIARLERG